ncbi:hypothetical protein [Leptospira adleri]|uniref:Uncharacterized protein n=1 Tax=Leptospira adleri TaxID=2023186 RepID=A0A2M9YUL2_9LEPT|nr:hypothetical protein [Leptospira adleri]PJZ55228.1 hypothetical protein CH380_01595 [Leptospira adleri]PJZ63390.1 hypothetical protein CH376_02830 [Leptospira adleri]
MNVSLRTESPFPNLTGTYTIQIVRNSSSNPVDLTVLIEQEEEKIFVTAKLDSFSVASIPRVLRGRIADRNAHQAIVEFENGDWERYVFTEGRFSKHEFLF